MLHTCIVRRRWSPQAAKWSHSQRAGRVQFLMSDAGGGSGAVYLCLCVYVFVYLCLCIFVCKQQNTQMSDVRCWQWQSCCNPICCICVCAFVFMYLCLCICVCRQRNTLTGCNFRCQMLVLQSPQLSDPAAILIRSPISDVRLSVQVRHGLLCQELCGRQSLSRVLGQNYKIPNYWSAHRQG